MSDIFTTHRWPLNGYTQRNHTAYASIVGFLSLFLFFLNFWKYTAQNSPIAELNVSSECDVGAANNEKSYVSLLCRCSLRQLEMLGVLFSGAFVVWRRIVQWVRAARACMKFYYIIIMIIAGGVYYDARRFSYACVHTAAGDQCICVYIYQMWPKTAVKKYPNKYIDTDNGWFYLYSYEYNKWPYATRPDSTWMSILILRKWSTLVSGYTHTTLSPYFVANTSTPAHTRTHAYT